MPSNPETHTAPDPRPSPLTGVVVIGRNEGDRLIACLDSIVPQCEHVVYVDSGSTDDSVAAARQRGATVVSLDMGQPFTAARARNAGFEKLMTDSAVEYVQFVDGDCTLTAEWLKSAEAYMADHPDCAVCFGNISERHPQYSFFNRMIEREWDGAPGNVQWCGGIAMMRATSFQAVGGFLEPLIAGEEPELCVRLRERADTIMRLDIPMAKHDANMRSLGEWMKRARRAGHAFAEVSDLHRQSAHRIWARETWRPLFWTGLLAALVLAGVLISPLLFGLLIIFPVQVWRMAARSGAITRDGLAHSALVMAQKPWEAAGVIQFWFNKATGRSARLIEYRAKRHPASPS